MYLKISLKLKVKSVLKNYTERFENKIASGFFSWRGTDT